MAWSERTCDLHGTCFRTHLDRNDEYHRHGHEEYGPQRDRYPKIQQMFDDLKHNEFISHVPNLAYNNLILTCFLTDSVGLTLVTAHQLMNFVYDIWANRSLEDSRQLNGGIFAGNVLL